MSSTIQSMHWHKHILGSVKAADCGAYNIKVSNLVQENDDTLKSTEIPHLTQTTLVTKFIRNDAISKILITNKPSFSTSKTSSSTIKTDVSKSVLKTQYHIIIGIIVAVILLLLLCCIVACIIVRIKRKNYDNVKSDEECDADCTGDIKPLLSSDSTDK